MKLPLVSFLLLVPFTTVQAVASAETLRIPLSGNGPADAVNWDFQITGGRRAGEQAKIPVPSQWEQHGFGNYDYGSVPSKDKHKEDGIYQRLFTVPESWRGLRVRIVFDGAMTDTTVKVNGEAAGPTHQGGFYRFHFDITDKIQYGKENHLEVLVSKDSANLSVEEAERSADYWVFGGIYRPVWLEVRPPQSIDWTSVDARADGGIRATLRLDGDGGADRVVARVMTKSGEAVAPPIEAAVRAGESVELIGQVPNVQVWSAEEPNLYQIEFSLMRGPVVLHRTVERIGFRTLEVRPGKGVFVNGRHITVKGINRHCFRPESGRAIDPQASVDDVRLIKSMNMNAVRCSHYPPDKAFLDACDELGLYVEDELCTWQKPMLDTPSARRLVGELIRRDVNHPSILWWANGNEGGWNVEVDGDFARWDIQRRPVLHPWEEFSGFQTKHYPTWKRLNEDLAGQFLVMPTEYLHGLYDGGHGAGLEDTWNAIVSRPNGVGGFLWVLADEGIMRTDRNGAIDNWGTNAPDGIVGPHHEREAGVLTVKDIFCPVQIRLKQLPTDFDGRIEVKNTYDFRNLSGVNFAWKLSGRVGLKDPGVGHSVEGRFPGPVVAPGSSGMLKLPLPVDWRSYGLLELRVDDSGGDELWTWSWPVPGVESSTRLTGSDRTGMDLEITATKEELAVTAGSKKFSFDRSNGLLMGVEVAGKSLPIAKGPRLADGQVKPGPPLDAAKVLKVTASDSDGMNLPENVIDDLTESRWSSAGRDQWILLELAAPTMLDAISISWQYGQDRTAAWVLEISEDGSIWRQVLEAESRQVYPDWDTQDFPKQNARFARLRCLGNNSNEWNSILELRVGKMRIAPQEAGFTVCHRVLDSGACRIEVVSNGNLKAFAWTVHSNGWLDLDYSYQIDHPVWFHGVTFDLPETEIIKFSWIGQGPERVWANRMRGIRFGAFERVFHKLRPGLDFEYPHCAGFYAGIQRAEVATKAGKVRVECFQDHTFLRLGTNDEGQHIRTVWPDGDFSVLHAIPAIGNKFHGPELIGPQSAPHPAPGGVSGKIRFDFTL
jgi:hypothetical protein